MFFFSVTSGLLLLGPITQQNSYRQCSVYSHVCFKVRIRRLCLVVQWRHSDPHDLLVGVLPETAPSFLDAVRFSSSVKITSREWQELVPHSFIWMDYISVPQQVNTTYTELSVDNNAGHTSDLMKAVNSIPAYVEKCSHFFTICPPVRDLRSACSFTWCGEGHARSRRDRTTRVPERSACERCD